MEHIIKYFPGLDEEQKALYICSCAEDSAKRAGNSSERIEK